jgi:anti-sigma28 factor (negative regulator of flagellin synthesis)
MRISDNEVKKILGGTPAIVSAIVSVGEDVVQRSKDAELIAEVTQNVIAMPDREAFVAEMKARVESGQYNPTADEIVDAMVRRAIADKAGDLA